MNEQASKITVGAIFKKIVKQMGFSGSGVTVYKEYDAYYLFVNYQKSSFGKRFYINVAWIFKDMLENSLSDDEKKNMWKNDPVWPHVDTRIEDIPGNEGDLQRVFDRFIKEDRSLELEPLIRKSIENAIKFAEMHHDRTTLRELSEKGEFRALILKEV